MIYLYIILCISKFPPYFVILVYQEKFHFKILNKKYFKTLKTHCINCYLLESIFLMTGKKNFRWPGNDRELFSSMKTVSRFYLPDRNVKKNSNKFGIFPNGFPSLIKVWLFPKYLTRRSCNVKRANEATPNYRNKLAWYRNSKLTHPNIDPEYPNRWNRNRRKVFWVFLTYFYLTFTISVTQIF